MRRDPLAVLLRLRQAAVTAARQELAQALAGETAAERAVAAARREMAQEQEGCPPEAAADFALWLRHAREREREDMAALACQEAATLRGRAALAAARAGEKAALTLLEAAAAEQALAAGRREQAAMDEAAANRRRGGGSSPARR